MSDPPTNGFRQTLRAGMPQFGIFVTIPDASVAEICAVAGFDWVLIDAEHGISQPKTVLAQVHAVEGRDVPALVRVPGNDPGVIKPYLDVGVQTILVPMVDTAEEAQAAVEAVTYPPRGVRGVATTRAAAWGNVSDYFARARQELCLIVQIESRCALTNLDEIVRVEGLDAIFIGPSDLAASLGHLGEPTHPEVVAAVSRAIGDATAAGVPVGVFAATLDVSRQYQRAGASFIACSLDAVTMAGAFRAVLEAHRQS